MTPDVALIEAARGAREHAYAPYSHFRVGAAIRTIDGRVFLGCNLENISFGLTVCAERNALAAAAVAGVRRGELDCVAVVTDDDHFVAPCGACRQVLAELGDARTRVLIHNLRGAATQVTTLGDLLPHAFASFHPEE